MNLKTFFIPFLLYTNGLSCSDYHSRFNEDTEVPLPRKQILYPKIAQYLPHDFMTEEEISSQLAAREKSVGQVIRILNFAGARYTLKYPGRLLDDGTRQNILLAIFENWPQAQVIVKQKIQLPKLPTEMASE